MAYQLYLSTIEWMWFSVDQLSTARLNLILILHNLLFARAQYSLSTSLDSFLIKLIISGILFSSR